MQKLLIGTVVSLSLFANIVLGYTVADLYNKNVELSKPVAIEYVDTSKDIVDHYNAGFRSGAMDILAQQVECEGSKDPKVLRDYERMSEVLAKFGELDNTPYPCTE